MTVREALAWLTESLRLNGIDSAALDAELLVAAALKSTKEDLHRDPLRVLPPSKKGVLRELTKRRIQREPIAYITGQKEFYGRSFHVDQFVLVPRPETEHLVDEVLNRLDGTSTATVADIGTGSGCLAVTIAKERPNARVIATDISPAALAVARRNAAMHRVRSHISFLQGNLLLPIRTRSVDFVIANLPYVPDDEVRANPDLAYEPLIALRGQHGPERTLAMFLRQWYLRDRRPVCLLEIHPNQAERLLAENAKIGISVAVKKDLAGRDRIAVFESKTFSG